jgi:hypothetical protein
MDDHFYECPYCNAIHESSQAAYNCCSKAVMTVPRDDVSACTNHMQVGTCLYCLGTGLVKKSSLKVVSVPPSFPKPVSGYHEHWRWNDESVDSH